MHGRMTTICFMNQKGGVGKTTSLVSTAKILADRGFKVLVVDLDQQGNAGRGVFNIETEDKSTVLEVIKGEATVKEAVQRSFTLPVFKESIAGDPVLVQGPADRGIDVVASDAALSTLTMIGAGIPGVQHRLKKALEAVEGEYDFCLIDCPPAIGFETTIALTASDFVVIMTEASYFSTDGMLSLRKTISEVKEWYNPGIELLGVLVTQYDSRTKFSRQITMVLEESVKELDTFAYDVKIRKTIRVNEAHDEGLTVVEYAPDCTASRDYREFADELLAAIGERK